MHEGRRLFVGASIAGMLLLGGGGLLAGCSRARGEQGTVAIHWDRDPCAGCGMIISEARFACQVRGGPRRDAHVFDDLGCAVTWLSRQAWGSDPATRNWVTDPEDPRGRPWIDARSALYRGDRTTPMGFGFSPAVPGFAGAVSYETARARILARSTR